MKPKLILLNGPLSSGKSTLTEMHNNMMTVANKRSHVFRIEPILNDTDATHNELLQVMS